MSHSKGKWLPRIAARPASQDVELQSAIRAIFDPKYYREKYQAGDGATDPFNHFQQTGLAKGFDPSPLFDSDWYLEQYPEARAKGDSAVVHFLRKGWAKGYNPNPLFDTEWYLARYSDVADAGANPLVHFVQFGAGEGRDPCPLMQTRWYLEQYPQVAASGLNPLSHFLLQGASSGFSPSPLFDPKLYLGLNPSAAAMGVNPLAHFMSAGAKAVTASDHFDGAWYLRTYPDVAAAGLNPTLHYLKHGAAEGRDPGENFSTRWYLQMNDDVLRSGMNPLVHYLIAGKGEGRAPHPRALATTVNGAARWGGPDSAWSHNIDDYSDIVSDEDREPPREPSDLRCSTTGVSLVSFDVWSTLLHRECHPDEIKLQSARYLLLKNRHHLKPAYRDLATLLDARIRCENASAPYGDHEYRFADAVARWIDEISDRSSAETAKVAICKALLEHELAAELSSTWLDPRTTQIAREANAPCVYLSDFYMDGRFMDDLLRKHGVRHLFAKGYVSCDTYETKRSGLLFKRLLSNFEVPPAEVLHIGDNIFADQQVPHSLGIRTLPYNVPDEEKRLEWYGKAFWKLREGSVGLHEVRILKLLEDAASALPQDDGRELRAAGLRMAPLVFSYCLSVLEDAISCGDDTVHFFTREGYFSKAVFDAICEENPFNIPTPKSEILEVSRKATFAASLQAAESSELLRMWTLYSKQSPKALCVSLNLDERIGAEAAERVGLAFEEGIQSPESNADFQRFLADPQFAEHAAAGVRDQRSSLLAYLAQKGITPEDPNGLCVVDIGWRGTIQDNLSHLLDRPIRGHYLALFRFLNAQPHKSSKLGWLSDGNHPGGDYQLRDQVAPLEMIFNGPGGSVTGYERDADGRMVALTTIIPGEEAIVERLAPFREGVIAGARLLTNYIRLHGLMADHLLPLARNIADAFIDKPPVVLADAFGSLEHNESFGVGETDHVNRGGPDPFSSTSSGAALHAEFEDFLKSTRWPEGAARETRVGDWWREAGDIQKAAAPLAISIVNSPALIQNRGSRLAVFAPPPLRASGGHRTIFNMVRRLAKVGFDPHIYLEWPGAGIEAVEEYLAGTGATITMSWRSDVACDVALATIAHSAEYVASDITASLKGYLVQDFEALFNPVSDRYVVCENSFAQGLHHFTVGNWLTHVIQNQYGGSAAGSGLGVDTAVYHRLVEAPKKTAVCMLVQPDKPRRGNDLGLAALRILKRKRPDIDIYIFGCEERLSLDFETKQLGLINDLSELNKLYNMCSAGICISLSNPSRIPFEMMAGGCVPIDVYRYNNLMDYDPGSALLAFQSPASIAKALEDALAAPDPEARARELASYGARRTLDWEMDGLVNNLGLLLEGRPSLSADVTATYTDAPVIAEADLSHGATAFCDWQRHLAGAPPLFGRS